MRWLAHARGMHTPHPWPSRWSIATRWPRSTKVGKQEGRKVPEPLEVVHSHELPEEYERLEGGRLQRAGEARAVKLIDRTLL